MTTNNGKTAKQVTWFRVTWTADHEQYRQGHAIAFTYYDECAIGCGETLREAFDDALEDLAQQDVTVSSELEREMLAELQSQVSPNYKQPLDATVTDIYCAEQGEHERNCQNCNGSGMTDADNECSECEGEGTEQDSEPDCSVCAGEWHFYVSVDVKVEAYNARYVVNMARKDAIAELTSIVGDSGSGDIGVIVDNADAEDTIDDLVSIVREARADFANG